MTILKWCVEPQAADAEGASSVALFAPFVVGASLEPAGSCAGADDTVSVDCSPVVSTFSLLAFSLTSLFRLGLTPVVFLGGDLASTFSCVF